MSYKGTVISITPSETMKQKIKYNLITIASDNFFRKEFSDFLIRNIKEGDDVEVDTTGEYPSISVANTDGDNTKVVALIKRLEKLKKMED
jgi:hypothetical protein